MYRSRRRPMLSTTCSVIIFVVLENKLSISMAGLRALAWRGAAEVGLSAAERSGVARRRGLRKATQSD